MKNPWVLIIPILWTTALLTTPKDVYKTQMALGLFMSFLWIGYAMAKKIHWSVGLTFSYLSINAIYPMLFATNFFSGFDIPTVVGFEALVLHATVYLLAFSFVFTQIKDTGFIENLIVGAATLDALVMIINKLSGGQAYFMHNNPAIDGAFVVCAIPLLRNSKYMWALTTLFVVAVALTNTSSGFLGLGMVWAVGFLMKRKLSFKALASVGIVGVGIIGIGLLIQGYDQLLNSSGRVAVWKLCWEYFTNNVNYLTGAGMGSFVMWGPGIQIGDAIRRGTGETTIPGFLWMHNDWYQVLFETGAIGLFLVGLTYLCALWKGRKSLAVLPALTTYGVLAFIQMPMRHFLFTALGALLLVNAFNAPKKEYAD